MKEHQRQSRRWGPRGPAVLRVIAIGLLAAVFFLPADDGDVADAVWVESPQADDSEWSDSLARALLLGVAPGLVVRSDVALPGARELELLEAAARRAPVLVGLPGLGPRLGTTPPAGPRVGRSATVGFTVRGAPGDSVHLRLLDDGGVIDSVQVHVGATGEVTGGFRVQPAREGWHGWRVEAMRSVEGRADEGVSAGARVPDDDTAVGSGRDTVRHGIDVVDAGAWVRESAPLRVLVAAGTPSWESRFVVRALEEAGADAVLVQPLGRGLEVSAEAARGQETTAADGGLPLAVDALSRYDAVIVLADAPLDGPRRRALVRYVSERGGGVAVIGDDALAAELGLMVDGARQQAPALEVSGSTLTWQLPAELSPLPSASAVRVPARTLGALRPGTTVAASTDGEPILALRPFGRGRAAALGLIETWPWRLEVGREAEHRTFWYGIAEWLEGGARGEVQIEMARASGPVGAPVRVRVHGTTSEDDVVMLTRPSGQIDTLTTVAGRPGTREAAFLPDSTGAYVVTAPGSGATEVFVARAGEGAAPEAWARLALVAHRSGGAAVRGGEVEGWVARWADAGRGGVGGVRALLFGLIVAVLVAEWGWRRVGGWRTLADHPSGPTTLADQDPLSSVGPNTRG